MSSKTIKEKREVEYETRRTMCDLCGTMIKEGNIKLRLSTTREEEYDRPMLRSNPDPIDICGAECLKENINGLTVMLQSKTIPTTPELGVKEASVSIGRISLGYSDSKAEAPPSSSLSVSSLSSAAASIKLGC